MEHFYLVSTEHYDKDEPRVCWPKSRFRDDLRDDYMLVEIHPPLREGHDRNHLILAARLEGCTLFPINEWPMPVYVLRLMEGDADQGCKLNSTRVHLASWAAVHRDKESALSSQLGPNESHRYGPFMGGQ